MKPRHPSSTPAADSSRPLRVGFVALTDAAPLIAAEARGGFARHGLNVNLQREIGWATIRDKIIYGELDAAHAPAPMLWAIHLGLSCPAAEVLTGVVLNLHGNGLTLSRTLAERAPDAAALRRIARERRRQRPLTFGVVFPYSSHHLLMRSWLTTAGLQPERDVRIVVVPPAQMSRNLSAGTIDGFCAGEPWNSVAIQSGAGICRLVSARAQPGLVEKVLLVRQEFAHHRAAEHAALVAAVTEAAAWCDLPSNRAALADLLSQPRYLNQPRAAIAPALLGSFDPGTGTTELVPDFHVFHAHDANVPSLAKAAAVQAALVDAGLVAPGAVSPDLPAKLFRPDLYAAAHAIRTAAANPPRLG